MIDFENTKITFDEERQPYYTARGSKGKFQRVYLSPAEQQAHKEFEAKRVAERNSQAVAPAVPPTDGVTGVCGQPGYYAEQSFIPAPISNDEEAPAPGPRVVRRTIKLMNSIQRLTQGLYNFGAIDTAMTGEMRAMIVAHGEPAGMDIDDENEPTAESLVDPVVFVRRLASHSYYALNDPRAAAPLKVVACHAAPMITLAQYLMGLLFTNGDMASRAQAFHLMCRVEDPLSHLVEDIQSVYNNIQVDISEAGTQLLGNVPPETGAVSIAADLPIIELVLAVDEMLDNLSERMDCLSELLEDQI